MRSAILFAVVSAVAVLFGSSGQDVYGQSRTNQSGTGGFNEVRGKVYLPSGQSLDAPVEVELQAPFASLKVFTDRGGSFVFQNMSPGTYALIVNAGEQFEITREYFTIDTDLPPPRGIASRPSPKVVTVPVHLQLKRGVILRNEVINAKWAAVPKEAISRLKQGLELARHNKLEQAEAEIRKSIELSPTFAPAHTELGKLLVQASRLNESIETFRNAIPYDESDFDAHLNLGIALLNIKKYDQAEPALVAAAYLNRSAVTPHYYLGLVFVMRDDLDVAQKAFETAKDLNGGKSLPNIHKYLGRIYMKKDMPKEALEELETYLKLAPRALDADKVKKDISDMKAKHLKNDFV